MALSHVGATNSRSLSDTDTLKATQRGLGTVGPEVNLIQHFGARSGRRKRL